MEPPTAERLLREFAEAWNRRDVGALDRLCTEDCILHFRTYKIPFRSDEGHGIMPRWSSAFRDNRFTIEDIVTEGDRGAMRLSLAGTHRGSFRGVPPTGKPFVLTQMIFIRVKDGRKAELWEDHDELGLWYQLSAKLTDPERCPRSAVGSRPEARQ
jgi:steroid delta-isomerase-like uncharacterized protein